MDGSDRANFISAGVSVQLPLFSNQKQTQNQTAAKQRVGSVEFERDQAINNLYFEYQNIHQQYLHTLEQRKLYEAHILPTLVKQKESAMQSYESDKGDFRIVMALFLKEQQAKTMYQRLRVNEQKHLSSLNYLLGVDTDSTTYGAHQE